MKSKKATKRALLSSALSLVLCFSMLLGTTFAWFTDEAKTGVNMIQSGTLDVELMNEDGSASLKGQSLQFVKADGSDEVLWEPGVTFRTEGFQIVNKGNLALKYKVVINGISDGSYAELLDVIDFYVTTDKTDADKTQRVSLDDLASKYTPLAPNGETLAKIETDKDGDNVKDLFENVDDTDGPFYLFGHMDENAGNEYQDKQLTGLGITVYATQVEAEFDSFDNVYDEDAAPNMVPVAKVERILEPVKVTSALTSKEYTLDTAYTFSTMETYDAAQLSPYAEWNADFVITFDKDVAAGTAGLAGQYDFFSSDWLAFEIPEDIDAEDPVRLLAYAGIGMTYEELCNLVKEFDCGAFDVDSQNAGTTMTVELRLFETQKAATGSGTADPDEETGNYKTIAAYSYTFPVTPVAAETQKELEDAIANSASDVIEVELSSGNYIIPDSAQGKTLTITGNGDTVVATQDDGSYEGCDYSLDGATVTFNDITINTDSSTYTGYARCNGTYNNCTINGTYTLYGDSEFNNCTFNVSGDVYNIWTWGATNATFNNCTFISDGKAMLLYGGSTGTPAGEITTVLTLNDCVFNDKGGLDDKKAAVEIGNDYDASYELIVNNTTVNGYEINDKGINTGTTLWGNKNSMGTDKLNVVVDGVDVY